MVGYGECMIWKQLEGGFEAAEISPGAKAILITQSAARSAPVKDRHARRCNTRVPYHTPSSLLPQGGLVGLRVGGGRRREQLKLARRPVASYLLNLSWLPVITAPARHLNVCGWSPDQRVHTGTIRATYGHHTGGIWVP